MERISNNEIDGDFIDKRDGHLYSSSIHAVRHSEPLRPAISHSYSKMTEKYHSIHQR